MIDFLVSNWLWIAFAVAMLAVHRRGGCGTHGRHGAHGRHRDRSRERDTESVDQSSGGRGAS